MTEQTVVAVDTSDIVKPYAGAMEYLSQVYDGSTKATHEPGYNFISVTAVTDEGVVPLYGHLYSNVAPDWRSENAHMLEAFAAVRQATGGKGIFVIDRGGDRLAFFEDFLENRDDFVIRLNGKRMLVRQHDGRVLSALEMAQEAKFTHGQTVEVEKDGVCEQKIWRYGSVRIRVPGFLQYRLWLVVISGFGEESIMLLTKLASGGELLLQRAGNYLCRWRCEEEIRFLKQGFELEDVRVLKYVRLQNIMVFAVIAIGFLSRVGYVVTRLRYLCAKVLQKSKRIFSVPKFRYYALLDGIRFYLAAYRGQVSFPRQLRIRNGQLSLFAFPQNFG